MAQIPCDIATYDSAVDTWMAISKIYLMSTEPLAALSLSTVHEELDEGRCGTRTRTLRPCIVGRR